MKNSIDTLFKFRQKESPIIYGYTFKDDSKYEGLIKVGYSTREAKTRIVEQVRTARPNYEEDLTILLEVPAVKNDGSTFTDKDVHQILINNGIRKVDNEWFQCTYEDVVSAINELKLNERFERPRINNFKLRPEQKEAILKTKEYYRSVENLNSIPKFLWNAKMRFGKTFTTYKLVQDMNFKKVLILTFKPAVQSAWKEDLETHVDFVGWQFYSSKINSDYDNLNHNQPLVVFGSFQDFLGLTEDGNIKPKNKWIHEEEWDLVVFDEYHFGAWRENAKKLFVNENEDTIYDKELNKEEQDNINFNESFLKIKTKHYLFLSGTPFRALSNGEFMEDQIFNWTYTDEQKAKKEWDYSKGPNPYESLPEIALFTYKLSDEIKNIAIDSENNEFDLNEFFKAEKVDGEVKFVHENEVQKWLYLIRGEHIPTNIDSLKTGVAIPPLPFYDKHLLDELTHTIWFLPNVNSCIAMKNLLESRNNTFFHDYKIVLAAGKTAGNGVEALKPLEEAMGNPYKSKTITLTCGKLTTGVTVKPWSGIFMLRKLKSPETYFQAAFRVQSPWTIPSDKNPNEKIILKKTCFIFDFAINRALKQISDYGVDLDVEGDKTVEDKINELISFLPVLAYDGLSMNKINADDILNFVMAGTTATMLAKKWEAAILVNVDNKTLENLFNNKDALDAVMKIEGFRNLNKDLEALINKTQVIKDLKTTNKKLTQKEKKELSDKEKEVKNMKKEIREKLLKFASRIPIFMYLSDKREEKLMDVIRELEPNLFKKVTGLSIADFNLLVTMKLFNSDQMNEAIFQFKRYEQSSLEYTGILKAYDPNNELIGGWDTKIFKKDL